MFYLCLFSLLCAAISNIFTRDRTFYTEIIHTRVRQNNMKIISILQLFLKILNNVMFGRTPTHRTATTWMAKAVGGCVRKCVRVCMMCLPYTIMLFDPGSQADNDNN